MKIFYILSILFAVMCTPIIAADISLSPKYGMVKKSEGQLKADNEFILVMTKQYSGDLKKASEDTALRGWDYLRQNDILMAMRRFNQAWLLDNKNGTALWGMAVAIQKIPEPASMKVSVDLFEEAKQYKSDDIDFNVDYARAIGFRAIQLKDIKLVKKAVDMYSELYRKAPEHTLNLQNWAVTLYQIGNYRQAWEKIKIAELTPRANELDKNFIKALEIKMSRP